MMLSQTLARRGSTSSAPAGLARTGRRAVLNNNSTVHHCESSCCSRCSRLVNTQALADSAQSSPAQHQQQAPAARTASFASVRVKSPEAVADSPVTQKALLVAAGALAAFAGVVILNVFRSILRNMYTSVASKSGPGSLLASGLAVLLNIVGVDFGTAAASTKVAAGAPASAGSTSAWAAGQQRSSAVSDSLVRRTDLVQKHFPSALSVDDFLSRVEVSLAAYGFRGDNSLALTNVCRDESTGILKSKIDEIFGQAFNINGLGAVLTCGVTGIGAGLSHAPVDASGRERYVFFAFPHIAVDNTGEAAAIFRPGREGKSAACGALLFATGAVQGGLEEDPPGVHDASNPEGSILVNRLKRYITAEGINPKDIDIVAMTKIARTVIARDLDALIAAAVDTKKADYAVVTGVQIHSWPNPDSDEPVIEYVEAGSGYVVVDGVKSELDVASLPAMTPRQMAILAAGRAGVHDGEKSAYLKNTTVTGIVQTDPADPAPAAGRAAHEVPEWAARFSNSCC